MDVTVLVKAQQYDDLAADSKDEADKWYEGETGVVYPFGYGLSYTSFKQEMVSSNIQGKTLTDGNYKINVDVKVTNTGTVPGKEVVQLYWRAPYIDGGIEKASKVLCAFDKTGILKPGESEILTLSLYSQDVANYDCFDANQNGFCGYELDGGNYQLVLARPPQVVLFPRTHGLRLGWQTRCRGNPWRGVACILDSPLPH